MQKQSTLKLKKQAVTLARFLTKYSYLENPSRRQNSKEKDTYVVRLSEVLSRHII